MIHTEGVVFLSQTPTPHPFMVEIIRPPVEEQTISGLIVNSLGMAGAFAVAAIPLGLVLGYLLIKWNKRRPPEADHMPNVTPTGPPSNPVQ